MEDSADIELYEEIVDNPAYSSSSDTSKSDPVSFQFKEPRQTECREEDLFAGARSRPDPRIISHALAGKNSQEPRSCDTFVASVGVLERIFMTIVRYWRPLQIHLYSTHLRQWRLTWSPLLELPYATLLLLCTANKLSLSPDKTCYSIFGNYSHIGLSVILNYFLMAKNYLRLKELNIWAY